MGLLPADRIQALYEAAITCGLASQQDALLAGLPAAYTATLPHSGPPAARLLQTLHALSGVPALADGTVPIEIWLRNAMLLSKGRHDERIFEAVLAILPTARQTTTADAERRRAMPVVLLVIAVPGLSAGFLAGFTAGLLVAAVTIGIAGIVFFVLSAGTLGGHAPSNALERIQRFHDWMGQASIAASVLGLAVGLLLLRPPVPREEVPPPQSAPRLGASILQKLGRGIDTPNYRCTPIATNEYVGGKRGYYYQVNLKNATTKQDIYFPSGEYVLRADGPVFLEALRQFRGEVLAAVEDMHCRYEVFTRGSADATGNDTLRRHLEADHAYSRMLVLPQRNGSKTIFEGQPEERLILNPFMNKHLPNLRGRFAQEALMSPVYQLSCNVFILDGEVTPNLDAPRDRSAQFILFVDPDSCGGR